MIDTSLKISLLDTLKRIQDEFGVAYLYITHDLALGRYFAQEQRLAVMYLGQIIETGPTEAVISAPKHPYTRALISAGDMEERVEYDLIGVEIPSFHEIPRGCPLSPRCPEAMKGICYSVEPELLPTSPDRAVACHLYSGPREKNGVR
ncbi:MAG: ABC transporter ATP-binding protein [Spirochaetaceae bacterium]|nr:MAG: ABC transporter ATP-binding protein [Spirochaetaceae bacterium]